MTSSIEWNISGPASLHWVVTSSDWTLEEIQEHLERGFYYVEELDDQGRTPLLSLVERPDCSASVAEVLIQNGATVDRRDAYGRTPLFVALENEDCSVDVVKVLLYYGADPNIRSSMGTSPLIAALQHTRDEAIIRLLLKKTTHLETSYTDPSPLCVALCCNASKDVIKLLLDFGCDLDGCNRHNSALHCATSFPNPGLREDVLQVLRDAGANVQRTNLDGQQLMCFALQNGADVRTIEILLKAGVSLDSCTCHTTPLLCATSLYSDFLDMTRLRRLAKKRPEGYGGIRLRANVVRFLLDKESSSWSEEGMKPVLCALRYCDYETRAIKLLLDRASRRTMNSRRLLFCKRLLRKIVFSYNVTPAVIKLLIERRYLKVGAIQIRSKFTLLHQAIDTEKCRPEVIQVLLEKGCSVHAKNARFYTPLEFAIRCRKRAAILNALLAGGCRIGARASLKPRLVDLAIQQYDCRGTVDQRRVLEKRESLKMLFRFAFLEYPDFDVGYLISKGLISKVLLGFIKSCVSEVKRMQREGLGCVTLLDIVTQKKRRIDIHAVDHFLDILLDDDKSFPIYMDLILSKLDRKSLIRRFTDLPVYKGGSRDSSDQTNYYLAYECVRGITKFLPTLDILNFVLAFYYLLPNSDDEY